MGTLLAERSSSPSYPKLALRVSPWAAAAAAAACPVPQPGDAHHRGIPIGSSDQVATASEPTRAIRGPWVAGFSNSASTESITSALPAASSRTPTMLQAPYVVKVSEVQAAVVPTVTMITAGVLMVCHGSGSTICGASRNPNSAPAGQATKRRAYRQRRRKSGSS